MSTRATYQFTGKDTPTTTIYIHHDGYAEGASGYFYRMLLEDNKRGGSATTFIRANDGAEITRSHDQHSDTEYRYDLDGGGTEATLKAKKRTYGLSMEDPDKWEIFYFGTFREFIEQHTDFLPDGFTPFVEVPRPYGDPVYMNAHYTPGLDHAMRHLRIWAPGGHYGSGNWNSLEESATTIANALGLTDVLKEIEELKATGEAAKAKELA